MFKASPPRLSNRRGGASRSQSGSGSTSHAMEHSNMGPGAQQLRRPAPALLQTGPSPNTSLSSLQSGAANAAQSLSRNSSAGPAFARRSSPAPLEHTTTAGSSPHVLSTRYAASLNPGIGNEADLDEILCSEMQDTLAQVERSAAANHPVFNIPHLEALDELRAKQLALAQAWARSEVDEVVEDLAVDPTSTAPGSATGGKSTVPLTKDSTATRHASVPGDDAEQQPARVLDGKTKNDLTLARKRREANDRYFDRVNSGVLDVVATLEDVALSMRKVERESNNIWGGSDAPGSPGSQDA